MGLFNKKKRPRDVVGRSMDLVCNINIDFRFKTILTANFLYLTQDDLIRKLMDREYSLDPFHKVIFLTENPRMIVGFFFDPELKENSFCTVARDAEDYAELKGA